MEFHREKMYVWDRERERERGREIKYVDVCALKSVQIKRETINATNCLARLIEKYDTMKLSRLYVARENAAWVRDFSRAESHAPS